MATNNWDLVYTDEYNMYEGDSTQALPGSPIARENKPDLVDQHFFPLSTLNNSMMDKDENINGPVTDFWSDYPIGIDVDGYIIYRNHNTGINVRGPAGVTSIQWDDLTPEQKAQLKGADGAPGLNGTNGIDGVNGVDGRNAYEVWKDNGHPDGTLEDWYSFLANHVQTMLIKEGTGVGSAITTYRGEGSYAEGRGAFATGYQTSAEGDNSFTTGLATYATNDNQVALGLYNSPTLNSLLEIGNGTSNAHRSNALVVNANGNLTVSGSITDGNNNVLSNKVDQIPGKSLSTNDFTNYYKDFIDSYTVDQTLIADSPNPVSNSAVYRSIQEVAILSGKPSQYLSTTDEDLVFFHPSSTSSDRMTAAKFTNTLTWNPVKQNLKNGNNIVSTNNNVLAFGTGLTAATDNQIVFGKYNKIDDSDIFQIGWGLASNNRKNLMHLDKNGDFYILGEIASNNGHHVLSNKQDLLTFDNTITQGSNNMVTSGTIYNYLVAHGINPSGGLYIPEIASLQTTVARLQAQVNAIDTEIEILGNPRIIRDDSQIDDYYTYGVDNGEFYIKLIEDEEEEGGE